MGEKRNSCNFEENALYLSYQTETATPYRKHTVKIYFFSLQNEFAFFVLCVCTFPHFLTKPWSVMNLKNIRKEDYSDSKALKINGWTFDVKK